MYKHSSTIGIFAHANSGKTTLTEAFLKFLDAIPTSGSVDHGTTVSDYLAMERERGISIKSTFFTVEHNDRKYHIVDTPGHLDFSYEVQKVLPILDMAVIIISAAEGIQHYTRTLWYEIKGKNIPIVLFVNKIDRVGVELRLIEEQVRDVFGEKLLVMHSYNLDGITYKLKKQSQDWILEQLAQQDDAILDAYINGSADISKLDTMLHKCFIKGQIIPLFFGSALRKIGLNDLYSFLIFNAPLYKESNSGNGLSYRVFSISNTNVGPGIFVKVMSGKISVKDRLETLLPVSKISALFISTPTNIQPVDTVYAGELCFIQGPQSDVLKEINTFYDEVSSSRLSNPLFVIDVLSDKVEEATRVYSALCQLDKENGLNIKYNSLTGALSIAFKGELQRQFIEAELNDRYQLKPKFGKHRLILKEAPLQSAVGHASYGVFSSVSIQVSPLPRGSGVSFISDLPTNILHIKYQTQILRLLKRYVLQGVYGWEVTDAQIKVIDGNFNSAGSVPKDFNIATPLALFRALRDSKSAILSPVLCIEIVSENIYLDSIRKKLSILNATVLNTYIIDEKVKLNIQLDGHKLEELQESILTITCGSGSITYSVYAYENIGVLSATLDFIGPDPRNEIYFVVSTMAGSLVNVDRPFIKKSKTSKSKFLRKKALKEQNG